MQLNKPANAPAFDKNHRRMEPGQEPVTIKAGLVMGLSNTASSKNSEVKS
jgi:hypothetical protein